MSYATGWSECICARLHADVCKVGTASSARQDGVVLITGQLSTSISKILIASQHHYLVLAGIVLSMLLVPAVNGL